MIAHLQRLLESGSTFTVTVQSRQSEATNAGHFSQRGVYSVDEIGIMIEATSPSDDAIGITRPSVEWVSVEISEDKT